MDRLLSNSHTIKKLCNLEENMIQIKLHLHIFLKFLILGAFLFTFEQ